MLRSKRLAYAGIVAIAVALLAVAFVEIVQIHEAKVVGLALQKAADEAAQLQAQQKAVDEAAQRQAQQKAVDEAAQRQAQQKAADEAAQRQALQKAADEAAQRQALQKAADEAAQRQAQQKAADEAAQRQALQKAADNAAQRQALQKAADDAAQRQAPQKAADRAAQRQAPEKAADRAPQRQAPEKAADKAAQRQALQKALDELQMLTEQGADTGSPRPPIAADGNLADWPKGNLPGRSKGNLPDWSKGNLPDWSKGIMEPGLLQQNPAYKAAQGQGEQKADKGPPIAADYHLPEWPKGLGELRQAPPTADERSLRSLTAADDALQKMLKGLEEQITSWSPLRRRTSGLEFFDSSWREAASIEAVLFTASKHIIGRSPSFQTYYD